ncbi:hypothetical protein ACS3SW_11605 [Roseobacteraceae bacterium S113]
MADPHIIWTVQRTGGTTLAGFLSELSPFATIDHEPFNPDRAFGNIVNEFRKTRDASALEPAIKQAIDERPVLKHCHELMPEALNKALMNVTKSLGYRHFILERRDEVDRVLSRALARMTGAWGKGKADEVHAAIEAGTLELPELDQAEVEENMRLSHARRVAISGQFAQIGLTPPIVYFEDLYTSLEEGRQTLDALVDTLGFEIKDAAAYAKARDIALTKKGQNSARIAEAVPNIGAVRTALTELSASLPPVSYGA